MTHLFNANEIVADFDAFLTKRSIRFSAVIIGGAALAIMDVIERSTKDIDVLDDEISSDVLAAAKEFANLHNLSEHWLNCGPSSLKRHLGPKWSSNLQKIYSGTSIDLWTLSRIDFLKAKIWALCDRQKDLDDVLALKPSASELTEIGKWLKPLDGNPDWPAYTEEIIISLKKQMGI